MTLRPVVVVMDVGGCRDGHWQKREEEGETGVDRRKIYAVNLFGQSSKICSN